MAGCEGGEGGEGGEGKRRKGISWSKTPGYLAFDPFAQLPYNEAVKLRTCMTFKKKLKALTMEESELQEFCLGCPAVVDEDMAERVRAAELTSKYSLSVNKALDSRVKHVLKQSLASEGYEWDEVTEAEPEKEAREGALVQHPLRIPHCEVDNLMTVMTNGHVAHEIAINSCYRLQSSVDNVWAPEPGNPTMKQLSKTLWAMLKQELKKNAASTSRSHASFAVTLEMLAQLRLQLLSVLMPHNHHIRQDIHRVLHTNLLRITDMSDDDVSDLDIDHDSYKNYALDILARICCPSRDAQIQAIRKVHNPVKAFRQIFELIFHMKNDMNNFFLSLFRPSIIKNSIESERRKFADFLELEYRLHEDGLRATRAWLLKHRQGVRDTVTVIAKAYGEILFWQRPHHFWPETLLEDIERFRMMNRSLERIGIVGGIVLEIGKLCHKIFKKPPPTLRHVVSKYVKLLVPTQHHLLRQDVLAQTLEPVARKSVEAIRTIITKYLKRAMRQDEQMQIFQAVMQVASPENKFRKLMIHRTVDYAEDVIIAAREYHVTLPSALTAVMYDVALLVSEFHRIVLHNRACFEELYLDIVEERNSEPVYPEDNDWNWDAGVLQSVRKLRMPVATPEEARDMEIADQLRYKLHAQVATATGADLQLPAKNERARNDKQVLAIDGEGSSITSSFSRTGGDSEEGIKAFSLNTQSSVAHHNFNLHLVHTINTITALHRASAPPPKSTDDAQSSQLDVDDTQTLTQHDRTQFLQADELSLHNELKSFRHFCNQCAPTTPCAPPP